MKNKLKLAALFVWATCIFCSENAVATEEQERHLKPPEDSPLAIQIKKRLKVFKEIIDSKKPSQLDWWTSKYGVEFEAQPVRYDSFYRWSGIQILNLAQGDINGIQPVPKALSDEVLSYLKARGYSNAATGKTQSLKGQSEDLKRAGVNYLTIEKYFDGDAISGTSKKPIFHVSFEMVFYLPSGQGKIGQIYLNSDRDDSVSYMKPLANYERLMIESNDDFFVIGVENIVFEEGKCRPTAIALAQCFPITGVFKVDYFHIGE